MVTDKNTARKPHRSLSSFIRGWLWIAGSVCLLSACQTSQPQTQNTSAVTSPEPVGIQAPLSDSLASNFLMARQAIYGNDLGSATEFFTKSLIKDDNNVALLRQSFLTQYQSGNIVEAAEIARRMESLNVTMPLASEPALIEAAIAGDWEAVVALADLLSQSDTSVVVAGVAKAWSYLALNQFSAAVSQMTQTADLLQNDVGLTPAFMELQKAHLLEAAGKHTEALTIIQSLRLIDSYPPHIQLSIASAYHRLGRRDLADSILANHLSPSFDVIRLRASFADNSNRLLAPMTLYRGLSQSLLDTSWLDYEKSIRSLLLARAHLALLVNPEFDAANFVIAQELLALGQRDTAMSYLTALSADSAYYLPSQLALISYLRRADASDEALDLARDLRRTRPQNERLLLVESDILRSIDRCGEAVPLYQTLLGGQFDTSRLHRNLAICLERTATTKQQEDLAESYFLSSLDQDPNDAYTLNYLGYWYADTNRNLDKAIEYIQKAVKLRPSSGYFADSLGWVYYRLEDYEKATLWLEKAIQLEPLDPVITEHLGDAYWRLGRTFEAVYKWQMALEHIPSDSAIDSEEAVMRQRILDKLDQASLEEGDPLHHERF